MKKILLLAGFIFYITSSTTFAADEIKLDTNGFIPNVVAQVNKDNPDGTIKLQTGASEDHHVDINSPDFNPETVHKHLHVYDELARTAHDVYNLQIENTKEPACLLKEPMTHHFERGPIDNVHLWWVIQMNNATTIPENGGGNDKFSVNLINVIIDGQFKSGKENFRLMFDPAPQHNRGFFHQLPQDVYIESHRIKNNVILFGNSRVGGGIEATQSPYTLPFVNRSQIARNFGNIRKFGIRLKGNYALVDYDLGGYSSDTYFSEFFPGVEFNGMVNFKPLGLTDGRWGKMRIGGGVVAGENHGTDYVVSTGYLGYEYKKFWTRMEYANADGSNGGDGLNSKKRQGWCVTFGYHLTKKLELLARYDEFDPDKSISSNNRREYTAGINYYLKGQALKLILNYVFCQNESAPDSHRIVVGTQIAI